MQAVFDSKIRLCAFVFIGITVAALAQSERKQPATIGKNFLSHPLPAAYQHWLDEDVRWIINDDERNAFEKLTDNNERNRFIEQFWLRRDPTPGTTENEFKEEHYRRIAYSNERFAALSKRLANGPWSHLRPVRSA